MVSLPTMGGGGSAGLPSSLGASIAGLVAGSAITLAVIGGLFDGETAVVPAETQSSKVTTPGGAASERIDALEELNSFYLTALERINEVQPSGATPPSELGQLYDTIVSRVVVERLSLDAINAMFDAAIREATAARG
jgi:hypothetical protein